MLSSDSPLPPAAAADWGLVTGDTVCRSLLAAARLCQCCHIATAASALPNITLCFNRILRQLGTGARLIDVMYILHNKLNVWKQLETLPLISLYQNKQSGQLARRPQLRQAGVVPGLAHPGVVLEISETMTEVRSCSRLRISRLDSGGGSYSQVTFPTCGLLI